MKEIKKCSVCEGTNRVCNTNIGLLCGKHYQQYKKYGKVKVRTKYDPNEIVDYEDYCEIILYDKDSNEKGRAIIDIEDKALILGHKWHLTNDNYVANSKFEYLHRVIMNPELKEFVDHTEGNTLDNRKSKLRICSNAENLQNRVKLPSNNTSGIIGIMFEKRRGKWRVEIQANKKSNFIGYYETKDEAIFARKDAEIKYFKFKKEENEID